MRRCNKCKKNVEGSVHYCPYCGTLLPGEKEMTLVSEEEYAKAVKRSNYIEVETERWNEMKTFYQSHLSTGYAPKGKQLIAKSELAQLRKNNLEYEQAVKANGKNYLGRIRCNVTQRHQKKINHVGFEDFWKSFLKKKKIYNYSWIGIHMFLYSAYFLSALMGFTVGWWGLVLFLLWFVSLIVYEYLCDFV